MKALVAAADSKWSFRDSTLRLVADALLDCD
jgi:hypothetical protein